MDDEKLRRFFHRHKTDLSLMENPHTFLNRIRDYNLIPEDSYKKLSRMRSKENLKKHLYEFLDWFEEKHPDRISSFWKCVFEEPVLHCYPTLQWLQSRLLDGSFHLAGKKRKELSNDEVKQPSSVKKKRRKTRDDDDEDDDDDDDEQPGPSSQQTPSQKKKPQKLCFSSPLKKGEKGELWTWPIYKTQLPVTCGGVAGTLRRDKLAQGERCIVVKKRWFTPAEFEKFAGKESCRNWKVSIRCSDTCLGKLMKEGHLKAASYKRRSKKAKRWLFPSSCSATESEREEEEAEDEEGNQEDQSPSDEKESDTDEDEETEDQSEQQPESSHKVFPVTCGAAVGTLHTRRFASGNCGKSIRTEESWLTPMEFTKQASCQTDASWRKDIKCEGEALSALIEAKILRIHSLLCKCKLCKQDATALENQKNDDECCICKSGEEEEEEEDELVMCDHCPRSFHPKCHLPHVDASDLRDDRLWMCTFCVFTANQEYRYSEQLETEPVLSRQISANMLECQYLLLCLCSADEDQIFTKNPVISLDNYSAFIKTPMWLELIADGLQRRRYQTVGQFVSDVRLIFTNCATFNRDNAEFLTMGEQLNRLFDEEFRKAFNIQD